MMNAKESEERENKCDEREASPSSGARRRGKKKRDSMMIVVNRI
tara:strand:- start:34 stop:165 length:132 start_codon:yes stop_codon:yes gene_type:complete